MNRLIALALILCALPYAAEGRRRRPKHGYLQVNSMTEGATVFVDHNEIGQIPLPEKVKLPPGKHTLKMTKRGFTQFLEVFEIERGKVTALDIDLLPVAGVFIIKTNVSEARVHIDGKFVGNTPLETEALIGKRTIRLHKAGFYDYVIKRAAIAGQTQRIFVRLKPLPVGTTPYRPAPPPPPKWYEKWWTWAGIGGGVVAVALTVTLSVTMASKDEIAEYDADKTFIIGPGANK